MGFTPDEFDREDMKALFTMFVNNLRTFPQTSIGDGVFSFRCHVYEVDPSASYWLFVFFDSVGFLGLTSLDPNPKPNKPLNQFQPVTARAVHGSRQSGPLVSVGR
jgi:hypothetical protein